MRGKQIAFIGFLVFLLLAIGLLVFTIDWGGSKAEEERAIKQLVMQELAETPASVTYRRSGPIVANQDHRELVITVSRGEVVARILKGYEGTVIKTERIKNNEASFRAFLAGLEDINFNDSRVYYGERTQEGACPAGRRFTYTLEGAGEYDFETWSTSCNKGTGTFAGSNSQIERMFKAQVPNINDLIKSQKL